MRLLQALRFDYGEERDHLIILHYTPMRFIDGQWVSAEFAKELLASWRKRGVRPESRKWIA